MIDFDSNKNDYLFSPLLSDKIEELNLISHLEKINLTGHVFILSSGTTQKSGLKGYALSKKAIMANAKAVNEHLGLTKDDTWLCSLPHYHIGGLSIYARAHLSGARVISMNEKWSVDGFMNMLDEVNIVSVVPAQCHDLVKVKKTAPSNLKYLIVGGDYLNDSLHRDLINLDWPVIRTFGMTEVCSQLATELKPSKSELLLKPLGIHALSVSSDHRLLIKSDALFSGSFICDEDGFKYVEMQTDQYLTSDLVKLEKGFLIPMGRTGGEIKIKARRIDFYRLKNDFKEFLYTLGLMDKVQIQLIDDVRDGYKLQINSLIEIDSEIQNKIIHHLKPIDISDFKLVDVLNKTELGKDKN